MTAVHHRRLGLTLIELVIVIAICGILMALLLPAVQSARAAAARVDCSNRLRQLALAMHGFHDKQQTLPAGMSTNRPENPMPLSTWAVAILPFLEQDALWTDIDAAYRIDRFPFNKPPHWAIAQPLAAVQCPADGRARSVQTTRLNRLVALTSYLGVSGTDLFHQDGVLFADSKTTFAQILDGTSNTLLLGERPPSPDSFYGWWYAGVGQLQTGSVNIVLGVCEKNVFTDNYGSCFDGPYQFRAGRIDQPCDRFHFWSFHPGGANFAMCDGSVHFFSYSADAVLPALSTRASGEAASIP